MKDKTYPDSGQVLYNMMEEKIVKENKIVIDLQDITSLPSMFLNVSIGRFIEDHGVNLLRQKVAFANISATQAERIKEYVDKVSKHSHST